MTEVVFYVFAAVAVLSATLCILQRSPMVSALWLISTMFSLAAIYVLLNAQFIAAAQVLVYAGAIMVLFLFVIMLLNLGRMTASDIQPMTSRLLARAARELSVLRTVSVPEALRAPAGSMESTLALEGAVNADAKPLFQAYLVPFEI